MTCDDWKLNPRYFRAADDKWGPHEVDAFASRRNAQLPNFWSEENDAFSQCWTGKNIWANPPWRLIYKTLLKVLADKATITLCLPYDSLNNEDYTPLLLSMIKKDGNVIFIQPDKDTYLKFGDEVHREPPFGWSVVVRISYKIKL